jgi:hypothetical protein
VTFNLKVKIGGKVRVKFDLVKKGKILEVTFDLVKRGGNSKRHGERIKGGVEPHFGIMI